jgi:CelD/BcsL family acetyltransferase involved in cellulose biosynthesis
MTSVAVSMHSEALDLAGPWDRLVARASGNVFMNPAALNAVHASQFAQMRTLLAWEVDREPRRLVGLWALREKRGALPPAILAAPPYDYAFVSNPVVDSGLMEPVIAAFFDAIETEPSLPKVLRLRYLDAGSESYAAIRTVLSARKAAVLSLAERTRPFATRACGAKRSGSTRKKLRQDWNRLAANGAVEVCNERSPAAAQAGLEVFLVMEAASWKGAQGTALLARDEDAAFARAMIGALAAQGNASVALLRLEGRPIAAQVLLYCGATAYTWKTAFAAEFGRYSPGALLVDKITEQLFADPIIQAIESCSPEGSFMGQLWAGTRPSVDLLVDVGSRRSLSFGVVAAGERAYAQARLMRNRLRAMPWWPDRKRAGAPVAPA